MCSSDLRKTAGDGSASARLAESLLGLEVKRLPAEVIRAARIRLLDGLACGLYGATMPWSTLLAETVHEEGSRGAATVFGRLEPAAPARAALVNGTAMHGIELDDIAPGHCHPGAMVIPSVLATAEQHGLSGERVVLGMVAGYEAASRTGMAIGEIGWGFHLPAIDGAIGATVASGVALGLAHRELMYAIGIACSCAAGIRSFVQGSGGKIGRAHV